MAPELTVDPDRLFPAETETRACARDIYDQIRSLPIVSMHGHVPAELFDRNEPFSDPASLLVTPDHYVTRIIHSQGVPLENLGVRSIDGELFDEQDPRSIWRLFCSHWKYLAGTASSIWLAQELVELFGIDQEPSDQNADLIYDQIAERLESPEFRPRELYRRFGLQVIASTDNSVDDLHSHERLRMDPTFDGTVIPTFRPDDILDATRLEWPANLEILEKKTGQSVASLEGLLSALSARREFFISAGATATDHGPASSLTLDLEPDEAEKIYQRLRSGRSEPSDALRFGAHMLCAMARMSCSDGLVMQLHPGVVRNHDQYAAMRFGRDIGADFPAATSFTNDLAPLLREFGSKAVTIILYTVDEAAYGREIAPMASYYPAVRIGAPWWFLDTPDTMRRCFRTAVESAGFWNFAGFVDDSRSLCSIPARHDMARRIVSGELARLVAEHTMSPASAVEVARAYSYDMPKLVFRLPEG